MNPKTDQEDLALVAACLRGEPAALNALELRCSAQIEKWVREVYEPTGEVLSALRDRLLPPPLGQGGKLASYDGKGSLDAWLRVVATRIALDFRRTGAREQRTLRLLSQQAPRPIDPTRDALYLRYKDVLERIVQDAMATLDDDARWLIRMYFVAGASFEELGLAANKNRSTMYYRLEKILSALAKDCRRAIKEEHDISDSDIDSLLRTLLSRLDVSIS